MTRESITRCAAYLDAQSTIWLALGWDYPCAWWLPRPEGVQ